MKHKLTSLIVMLFTSVSMWAYSFSTGGFAYHITNKASKTVELARIQSYQEKVVIPRQVVNKGVVYTVTGIGESAFSNCDFLSGVTIPNSVKYIDKWAFAYCSLLQSIVIPNSVKTIGASAFYGCSISKINIPASVKEIGEGAFSYCPDLETITVNQTNRTFDSRDKCNAIIETATNTLICGCISSIIPKSVTTIGKRAFSGCLYIKTITIPQNVKSIASGVFEDCRNLENVVVEDGNPCYDSRDSCNAIIETETNTLIAGCRYSIIPENVKRIGEYAFYKCTHLTSIVIPDSIEVIGKYAFDGSGLWTIEVPGSVKSIEAGAFSRCNNLESISMSEGTETIGFYAIYNCPKLQSITIPKSLKMEEVAIGLCPNLCSISVEQGHPSLDSRDNCNAIIATSTNTLLLGCRNTIIPNTVTRIADNAFGQCKGLQEIRIPKSVVSIESNAFNGCDSVKSITVASGNPVFDSRNKCNAIIETATRKLIRGCNSTVLPRNVKGIGDYAFTGCTEMTQIILPEGLTSIGNSAFSGCTSLTDIKIPSTLISIGIFAFNETPWMSSYLGTAKNFYNNVAYINDIALYSMGNITECTLKSNTKSIAGGAFQSRNGLTSVSIPYGVEEIGELAFSNCKYLKQITMPNSVKRLGEYSFYDCSELSNINLTDSIDSIGCYAFYGCSSLKEIVLPNNVKHVWHDVFGDCKRLTSVVIGDSMKTVSINAFRGSNNINKITVNSGNPYLDSRDDCNAVIETATNTLIRACKNTTIPNSITSIGYGAFYNLNGLTAITIPNSVTNIGEGAFDSSDLQSITIPSCVKTIGEGAFLFCDSLKTVINHAAIPQEIKDNCFTTFGTLIVPQESVSAYKEANVWNKFNIQGK